MKQSELQPPVSIVIVNYNGYDDTKECLESIRGIEYNNYQVIVVDNASSDDSVERLEPEFSHVTFINARENLGYTGGNNLGIERAAETGAKYIFILNNDTVVSVDAVSVLSSYMESHSDIGMAGPLVLYYDDPEVINFGGGNVDRNTGRLTFFNSNEPKSSVKAKEINGSFLYGCALFVRTNLIREIGGFDDIYFLTAEETELCVRIRDLGHRLTVVADAVIWHKVSGSMKAGSMLWSYFMFRNKLYFVNRNSRGMRFGDRVKILKYYGVCFLSMVLKNRNFPGAAGLVLGVVDYLRGETGKGWFAGKI